MYGLPCELDPMFTAMVLSWNKLFPENCNRVRRTLRDEAHDWTSVDPLVFEPRLERLCVLRVVTIYPSETLGFSIDLVLGKSNVVDLDLETGLSGGFTEVFVVRPLNELGV